jgi:replicative DNA helicase
MIETRTEVTPVTVVETASDQALDALNRLDIIPSAELLRLPWDSLHDILGYLWPEAFWVVAASTGNGKSTLLMQLVEAWAEEGAKVYVLPLEQPAEVMRQYWAALACRLDPMRVLENDWNALPREAKATVTAHLKWQVSHPGGRYQVAFSPTRLVGEAQIVAEFERAAAFGAHVVILDHLHRLDIQGGNGYQALVRLCQRIKECAKAFQIPCLAAAQLHRDKEGDVLAPFLPPKPTAIQGGEVVRQEADVAIGLYRPLLDTFTAENARAVRMGQSKIRPFLEPNTVGVHVLKHRVRGKALGELLKLRYEHGRIRDPQTDDRLAYEHRNDL